MKLRFVLLLVPLLTSGAASLSQPAKLNPNAEADGQALVLQLLANRPPAGAATNRCVLNIRPPRGQGPRRTIPVAFHEVVAGGRWTSIYESAPTNDSPRARLTIVRKADTPNEYRILHAPRRAGWDSPGKVLAGGETMVPFADSDFWVADLGLEFLHWPTQRLLKKEMTRGQSCNVLESVAPVAQTNGYVRVKSWLDIDTGGVVYAEAYDTAGRFVKEFAPKGLKKVNDAWEVEELEIINRQTGSRTRLLFDTAGQPAAGN